MARVTGIGGVFLRAKDPKALVKWYAEHLHVPLTKYGMVKFEWADDAAAQQAPGVTAWSAFPSDTAYFGPGSEAGPQAVMVNYRVDDLDGLLEELAAGGVTIDPKREEHEFGRFAWVTDPEGNRLELWQPPREAAS